MKTVRLAVLAAMAAPALMLGACKKGGEAGGNVGAAAGAAIPAPQGGWAAQVRRTDEGGYLMGNPDAPVKLIEYGSRTCPHCAHFDETGVPALKANYIASGRVSYEFRDYAIHAPDMAAILVGQCTSPETFFPILEQMMAAQQPVFDKLTALPPSFQQSLQGKSPSAQATAWGDYLGYVDFVGQRGVPPAKARACLADTKALDALAQHMADGTSKYGITGTPTFIINGEMQQDTNTWEQLEPKLKVALGQ